jgi:hypothetical protein
MRTLIALRNTTPLAKLLLLWLITTALRSDVRAQSNETSVASGTLVLLGVSSTDITFAADSKSIAKIAGPRSNDRKIVPMTRFSMCATTNDVELSLVDPTSKKVIDDADLTEVLRQVAKDHPSKSTREAYSFLIGAIEDKLRDFYTRHQNINLPLLHVSVICSGYEFDSPEVLIADIHQSLNNKDFSPALAPLVMIAPPGYFASFGENQVCNELLDGSNDILKDFSKSILVQKYHHLKNSKRLAELTTSDLVEISHICLAATESDAGLSFDRNAFLVGPPNYYYVISKKTGERRIPEP